jgi:hypothetical protein
VVETSRREVVLGGIEALVEDLARLLSNGHTDVGVDSDAWLVASITWDDH